MWVQFTQRDEAGIFFTLYGVRYRFIYTFVLFEIHIA